MGAPNFCAGAPKKKKLCAPVQPVQKVSLEPWYTFHFLKLKQKMDSLLFFIKTAQQQLNSMLQLQTSLHNIY